MPWAFACLTCSTLDDRRSESPYYSDGRFRNIDGDPELEDLSFWTIIKWKFFTRRDKDVIEGASDESPASKPVAAADLVAPPGKIRVTWIGHATAVLSFNRQGAVTNIITDPIFASVPLVKRRTAMPLGPDDFPEIHAAVVSHSHLDHCDLDALQFLHGKFPNMKIFLPEGLTVWAQKNELDRASDLRWWTATEIGGVKITFLPAHHWSRRALMDRFQSHWGSYAFSLGKQNLYFAGDTGYSSHFRKIAEKFPQGFDAVIMPVGAYAPRWFMRAQHIDPVETVTASVELGAKMILPVHWATFQLGDEKMMEPIFYLKKEAAEKQIAYRHWVPGESYDIELR